MKQIFLGLMIFLFSTQRAMSQNYSATNTSTAPLLSPETKAFLIICGYGTVGGALLGLASMAFGGKAINIAKGASVGLYSGILFGAYVIYSHDSYTPAGPQEMDNSSNYGTIDLQIKTSEYMETLIAQDSAKSWYMPIIDFRF